MKPWDVAGLYRRLGAMERTAASENAGYHAKHDHFDEVLDAIDTRLDVITHQLAVAAELGRSTNAQAVATNGRLGKAEERLTLVEKWMERAIGARLAMQWLPPVVGGTVVGLILKFV